MKFSYSLIKKLLPGVPQKTRLIEALNMHSFETEDAGGDVLEISLPPNRYSDAASHIGIAREAAAILSGKFSARGGSAFGGKNPVKTIVNLPADLGLLNIKIQDAKTCPRYGARCFQIKDIKASPKWMQDVLLTCGLKPIGNVVDIMNYVMLETGQPLHAFDYEKIGGRKIVVRRARKKEKIKTLDGQNFSLDQSVLVIADKSAPMAIAGIKGGLVSGVGPKTKRIVVEAANFDPTTIFKTARKLKLQTDAALRFSHGLSPALVDWGLDRATKLLLDLGARLLDSADVYPRPVGEEVIGFDPSCYTALIGASVKMDEAKKFFQALGFSIDETKNKSQKLLVRIPAWRTDIEEAEDLIEEVARLKGYDNLRPVPPVVSVKPAREDDLITLKERIRTSLKNLQLDEVYSSSFVGDADLRQRESGLVELENPIAEDKKYLRPSLLPLLSKDIEANARFFDRVRIFEVGKIFLNIKGAPKERLSLGIALGEKDNHRLILELKGIIDELLKSLGVDDFSFVPQGDAVRIEADHKVLGEIVQINLEKRLVAAFVELDLEATLAFTEDAKEYVPLKRFPAVLRDISVLLGQDVGIGDVAQEIQYANTKLIENVDLVDEYTDEKLGGKRSLTFRIIFQAEDRTLTDVEVNREMEKVGVALKKKFKAEVR